MCIEYFSVVSYGLTPLSASLLSPDVNLVVVVVVLVVENVCVCLKEKDIHKMRAR